MPSAGVLERLSAGGRVIVRGGVSFERLKTAGRVEGAEPVEQERFISNGRVVQPVCVGKERVKTYCRITGAFSETEQRVLTLRSVPMRIPTVWWRADGEKLWPEGER